MPRRRRIVVAGMPHHVTHRGNRKDSIFLDRQDWEFYLDHLREYSQRYQVGIYSYCLMSNHVHLIAVPKAEDSLSKCLHGLHGRYSRHFNWRYSVSGHLWQERFYACVLDSSHLWNAVRYVEQNPVRAKLVSLAADYRWSSARSHCGLTSDPILSPDFPPEGLIPDWQNWLARSLDQAEVERIRQATWKGVPYASKAFIRQLESLFGLGLRPSKPGRKTRPPRQ